MSKRFYPGQETPGMSARERKHRELVRQAAAECMVLLENDGILPLKPGAKLALFGRGARRTIKGGTGSGDVNSRDTVSVDQGLRAAGFEIVNTSDLDAFDVAFVEAEKQCEVEIYAAAGPERDAMKMYQAHASMTPKLPEDFSFVTEFLSRIGWAPKVKKTVQVTVSVKDPEVDAGIFVLSRISGEGVDRYAIPGDYYLTPLEKEEMKLAQAVCGKLIVVLNVGGIIDLSFLDEIPAAAVVLMGQAGVEGGNSLADVLSGKVNPSGHLTDTWAYRYEDYPSSEHFSHQDGNLLEEFYTDGIYVGYRYFDTFGVKPRYPFGYGLSYTTFSREFIGITAEGTEIAVRVMVRNTGKVPGRQVLQLYVACPACPQGKEAKRLVAFGKTRELAPGEGEELTLRFSPESLTSFRGGAFVLDPGDYLVMPGFSGEDTDVAARLTLKEATAVRKVHWICELLVSLREIRPEVAPARAADPALPALALETVLPALLLAVEEEEKAPKAAPLLEKGWEIASRMTPEEKTRLVVGVSHNRDVIGAAAFSVPGAAGETAEFPEKGIPAMVLADGPAGLRLQKQYEINPENGEIYGMTRFEVMENRFFGKMKHHEGAVSRYQFATAIPVGFLLAQSFDPALLGKMGELIAEEMREFGVAVWLAPGMNIHRNPLCGRNFEYYSEDPLVSGIMAAAITRGVQKDGDLATCIKHYACNNQEEDRFHVTANVSERALREIYLKGFEIAVRTAQPWSIMTSYNRVNGVHSANSRDLCTVVAREEWGFKGFIMTDWTTTNGGHGSSAAKCILAGNDLVMPGTEGDRKEILAALKGDHDRPLPEEKLTESAARLIGAALLLGKRESRQ